MMIETCSWFAGKVHAGGVSRGNVIGTGFVDIMAARRWYVGLSWIHAVMVWHSCGHCGQFPQP